MARGKKLENSKSYIVFNSEIQKTNPIIIWTWRENAGIPKDGFSSYESKDFKKWEKRMNKTMVRFLYECIEFIKNKSKPSLDEYDQLIYEYIVLGEPLKETYKKTNTTGCTVFVTGVNTFREGVYIRIGEYSMIIDIKNFIDQNKEYIDRVLFDYYGISKKDKFVKTRSKLFLQIMVLYASKLSREYLEEALKESIYANKIYKTTKHGQLVIYYLEECEGIKPKLSIENYDKILRRLKKEGFW